MDNRKPTQVHQQHFTFSLVQQCVFSSQVVHQVVFCLGGFVQELVQFRGSPNGGGPSTWYEELLSEAFEGKFIHFWFISSVPTNFS